MILNLPNYLDDMGIRQIKKMFTLVHRYKYQNEQAMSDLEDYMKRHLKDLKADWSEKSIIYQREYQNHQFVLSPQNSSRNEKK
jgi:hypothetical protein